MTKNKLAIKVNADTSEALKQMKEVSKAANECVAALEKLDKVMDRFTHKNEQKDMKISTVLDRKVLAESIVEQKTDGFKMKITDIKGVK
ncbi:hypothetical protein [Bacillus sp. FSL K6-0067]|uniref:hypothetical protein n=1 Tax=Bacillus sp. FSL K6-0067 TaxID=2921412 RepID=UPI00077B19A1|nr:hypothetical protein [Bacillus cereus]KXY34879.1 hypothetical protein AT267_00460 [Bacillus cereus]